MAKYFKNLGDLQYFNFQGTLVGQVVLNAATWNIPTTVVSQLTAARTVYEPLYNAITNKMSRTPAQVQNHQEGREEYEDIIEDFSNAYIISNFAISNSTVETLGFNRKSDQPGSRPVIEDDVYGKLEPMGGSKVIVMCRISSDSSRASMHEDADMVEVKYAIGDAPANVDACVLKEISTKAKFTLQLAAADAGKKIHVYQRWRNNVNPEKSGPWSTKLEAIIM